MTTAKPESLAADVLRLRDQGVEAEPDGARPARQSVVAVGVAQPRSVLSVASRSVHPPAHMHARAADEPLEGEIGRQMQDDLEAFEATARKWVKDHCD